MDEQGQGWPPPGASRDEAAEDVPATAESTEPAAGPPAEPHPHEPDEDAAGPAAPRPLGVGVQPTGHDPVDERLRRLEDADHLAVSGHLEVYEDVHRGLRETLAALDRHEQ
jgi:hypothetical protein